MQGHDSGGPSVESYPAEEEARPVFEAYPQEDWERNFVARGLSGAFGLPIYNGPSQHQEGFQPVPRLSQGEGFAPAEGSSAWNILMNEGKGLDNPFKAKTPEQIDDMFRKKGFEVRGPDPIRGKGGYVNPQTGRSYHIDMQNRFNEPPHVDVNRPKDYKGELAKRKFEIEK